MGCCWARQNWLLLSNDDATKRERVTYVACYFCRNNPCVQAQISTIRWTVIVPNGISISQDNQRTVLVTHTTLVHFVWLWARPRYSCVAHLYMFKQSATGKQAGSPAIELHPAHTIVAAGFDIK